MDFLKASEAIPVHCPSRWRVRSSSSWQAKPQVAWPGPQLSRSLYQDWEEKKKKKKEEVTQSSLSSALWSTSWRSRKMSSKDVENGQKK